MGISFTHFLSRELSIHATSEIACSTQRPHVSFLGPSTLRNIPSGTPCANMQAFEGQGYALLPRPLVPQPRRRAGSQRRHAWLKPGLLD